MSRAFAIRLLALFVPLATAVRPASAATADSARELWVEYCSLLVKCGLTPPAGSCSTETSAGVPGVKYDDARCAEARDLASRGLSPADAALFPIYRFLGKRYRVTYVVDGRLPISPARLAFVIDDLPLAAKLLTKFQGKLYTASYLDADRRRFRGSRQGSLAGEATRLAGAASEGRLVYFGYGRSQIGLWKLGGQSLAWLDFAPVAAPASGLSYSLKVLVTPDGAFINRIMNLGLFRKLVTRQIREVVDDIDAATRKLAREGLPAPSGPDEWSAEERDRVKKFLALP